MGASYRASFPAAGRASFPADARRVYRGGIGHNGGPAWDADAAHYIDRTGALFPAAVNDLVLGIKALGLWEDHVGSIKLAVGVPSLAASVLDLRNPAFDGTAVNAPAHSATAGWSFTAASTHYIDSGWQCGVANSKGSLNSVHAGARIKANTAGRPFVANVTASNYLGLVQWQTGFQSGAANSATQTAALNPAFPAHAIVSRTAADAAAIYRDGSVVTAIAAASDNVAPLNLFIGARNALGSPADFLTGRITLVHCGAGLTAQQASDLTDLFDAYAAAAGET